MTNDNQVKEAQKMCTVNTDQYSGLKPFAPGTSGNPAGRPKGARNKITKLFIDDLTQEWRNRGNQALKELTSKELVHACLAILPKDVLLAIQGDSGPSWVISASPVLSSDDWFAQAKEDLSVSD